MCEKSENSKFNKYNNFIYDIENCNALENTNCKEEVFTHTFSPIDEYLQII